MSAPLSDKFSIRRSVTTLKLVVLQGFDDVTTPRRHRYAKVGLYMPTKEDGHIIKAEKYTKGYKPLKKLIIQSVRKQSTLLALRGFKSSIESQSSDLNKNLNSSKIPLDDTTTARFTKGLRSVF